KNDTRVLIYPLNMNGVLYGSIIVGYSTNDNLTEYLSLLRNMASACILIFTQTTKLRDLSIIRKQEYINDLITWNFRSDDIALIRGAKVDWDIQNKSRLVIINLNELQTSSAQTLINLENFINDILYDGIQNVIKLDNEKNLLGLRSDTFVVLLEKTKQDSYTHSKALSEKILDYCNDTFKGSISIGVSSELTSFKDIPKAYKEALESAKIGRFFIGINKATIYEDLGFYPILGEIHKSDSFIKAKHHLLSKLWHYDEKNNS